MSHSASAPPPPALEVVILIGIPASGKTTFFRARFAATHAHVSKDLFPGARRPQRRQEQLLEEALASGRPVVVDNNNPTREERAALISLAQARGARVVGYYFESRIEQSLERNRARPAPVPDVAVFSMAKRLARPSLEEGFAALHHVRLAAGEGFVVSAWREEEASA